MLSAGWAVGKELAHAPGESVYVFIILFSTALTLSFFAPFPDFTVSQAFGFSLLEGFLFDQQSLPLVLMARAAPFQDYGGQCGVFAGAASKSGVTTGKKYKLIEVGAGEA